MTREVEIAYVTGEGGGSEDVKQIFHYDVLEVRCEEHFVTVIVPDLGVSYYPTSRIVAVHVRNS